MMRLVISLISVGTSYSSINCIIIIIISVLSCFVTSKNSPIEERGKWGKAFEFFFFDTTMIIYHLDLIHLSVTSFSKCAIFAMKAMGAIKSIFDAFRMKKNEKKKELEDEKKTSETQKKTKCLMNIN